MPAAALPRRPVRRHFIKFGLVVAFAVVAGLVSVVVAQPPAKASRPTDHEVALRVRAALDDQPSLKPHKLNLLVNVSDGVVVIGGAVPDAGLAPTIEQTAAKVDGAARVKVSVWALSPAQADPLTARIDDQMNPRPTPTPVAVLPTLSVPTDTPRPDPRPTADVTVRTVPNLLQPPVQSASRAPHTRPPGAEPPEYTPIPATKLPTDPILEPPPVTPVRAATPREPERAGEPDGWKRDPRFGQLTVDVRGGTAVIGGRARSHTAAWELAEQVRAWPAVERVVVGRVEVK